MMTLKKALNVLDVMNFGDEEREAYENHLKWLRIEANTIKKYEAKAFAEGLVEGKAEGLVEGEEIGNDKKAREIAKLLIAEGMALEKVSQLTALSKEVLQQLAADHVNL